MSKTLVVGECPSKTNDGSAAGKQGPLDGPSGARLARLMGVSLQEFLDCFDRVNLFAEHVPYDEWDAPRAETAAWQIMSYSRCEEIILLGRRVQRAFYRGNSDEQFFVPFTLSSRHMTVVPHPSGRNRFWNTPGNVDQARTFWQAQARTIANDRDAAQRQKEGE